MAECHPYASEASGPPLRYVGVEGRYIAYESLTNGPPFSHKLSDTLQAPTRAGGMRRRRPGREISQAVLHGICGIRNYVNRILSGAPKAWLGHVRFFGLHPSGAGRLTNLRCQRLDHFQSKAARPHFDPTVSGWVRSPGQQHGTSTTKFCRTNKAASEQNQQGSFREPKKESGAGTQSSSP